MKTIINNAITRSRLLGETEDFEIPVSVVIEDGVIKKVSHTALPESDGQIIDAKGYFLSPGLIDPQVHFREPGMEYKEDIESGSKAAVKGGFTGVVSMPNTAPTADTPDVVKFMVQRAKERGLCKVYPTGALSKGLAGQEITDFKALVEAGAVAITDDGKGVQNDALFKQALIDAKALDVPVLDHSEDESLSNNGAIHEGEMSERFNVPGIKASSEAVHVERGCRFSIETGGHYHVLHVSTKASIQAVKAAKDKVANVTVEVSPHHLLLCDEDIALKEDGSLDANWKMNPPLRSREDMMACQSALVDGTIDAIATDHAPHAPVEKAQNIVDAPFGIIGLETAFPLIYTHFVKTGKLSLSNCIDLMSRNAGALFKIECGRIIEGKAADLALFDLAAPFSVNKEFFASKSENSPFLGRTLFGATVITMVDGKLVYKRG